MSSLLYLQVTFFRTFFSSGLLKSGDSGGIMYTKDDGEYCALGITESSSGSYANFVKWNNIDDSFEIYFY